MKKIILFIVFIIINNSSFSQNYLTPLKSKSFGLNKHTNRDIAYFSHLDVNNNSIIVGTTEKDSTFTDILTTKLDVDYNLLWQKRFSIPTNLSYDIPLKSFMNSSNELYIVGRSSLNQSNSNGLIFILKYDENGIILYDKIIGNLNGEDYVDFGYMDVALNSDGSLNLVYAPFNYQTYDATVFNFLKIDNQGNVINSFTKLIENDGIIGKITSETFNFLTIEIIDDINSVYSYKFHRIQNENMQTNIEIEDASFINYYNNTVLSNHVKLTFDSDQNCYLTCNDNDTTDPDKKGKIHFTKIDINNEIQYSFLTDGTINYSLIDSFINEQNNNIVIANKIDENSIEFVNVDENNTLQTITNISNTLATGFKKNNDGSFFITTSNSNIRLFSNELSELKSFNTSDTYELIDFSKIDDNKITTTGIKYDKMFPESDFFTQLDIVVEKIENTQITNNYTYSGIGTSKSILQKIIIDNANNYLVLTTDNLGPEYRGIGGAGPPIKNRILKYDTDLNLLWELEIPDVYSIVYNGREVKYDFDVDNNLYIIATDIKSDIYEQFYKLIKVSSSGTIVFSKDSFLAEEVLVNESNIFVISPSLYIDYNLSETKVYTHDRSTGDLVNQVSYENLIFYKGYKNNSGDIYFYMHTVFDQYSPDIIKLVLYKENEFLFERELNLTANGTIDNNPLFKENGDLIFFSPSDGNSSNKKIHTISLNNEYSFTPVNDNIAIMKKLNNNKFFIINRAGNFKVYNSDFSLFSENNDITYTFVGSYTNILNDYLLYYNYYDDQKVIVFDENAQIVNEFNIDDFLGNRYAKEDQDGNLVLVGQNGSQIYTFSEYSWNRGFIKKFHINSIINDVLSVDSFNTNKSYKIYPNPTSDILNIDLTNRAIEKVVLYDITGKHLKNYSSKKIDLSNINTGIYFIKIFTTSNEVINSTIIKN